MLSFTNYWWKNKKCLYAICIWAVFEYLFYFIYLSITEKRLIWSEMNTKKKKSEPKFENFGLVSVFTFFYLYFESSKFTYDWNWINFFDIRNRLELHWMHWIRRCVRILRKTPEYIKWIEFKVINRNMFYKMWNSILEYISLRKIPLGILIAQFLMIP